MLLTSADDDSDPDTHARGDPGQGIDLLGRGGGGVQHEARHPSVAVLARLGRVHLCPIVEVTEDQAEVRVAGRDLEDLIHQVGQGG